MAKRNTPNISRDTTARIARCDAYAEKVRRMFAATVNRILDMDLRRPDLEDGVMYSFDGDYMKVQQEVDQLLRSLHSATTTAIENGITIEWEQANKACDRIIKSYFGKKALDNPTMRGWNARNDAARRAFTNRADNGLNLSKRIWSDVQQFKEEMEVALTVSIGEGLSAGSLSRRVRQYLNDPDLMFRRFRYKIGEEDVLDADGNVIGKKPVYGKKWKKREKDPVTGKYRFIDYDKDSYKVGRGMYKSAAQNAMRVARTETNIAYRRADHERWKRLDFVLGVRIELSKNHPMPDICDTLAGDYPKDFVFDGWHPQCFCHAVPILVDESEMMKMNEAFAKGEEYAPQGKQIEDYPQNFKKWVEKNADKIEAARARGTEPYFIRNNRGVVDKIFDDVIKEKSVTETLNGLLRQYVDIKPKMQGALPMDITGGIATSIMMALDNRIATTERTKIIKQITKLPKFRKYETVKNRTLWIWENIDNSEEFIKNYAAGSKALSKGYDVFMLPNPRGGKSPDFILSKGHKYYFYECKTINGMASVGARLNDAASQCDRIFLDVADKTESRMLANELISFYERNPQIKDIMIFKGKKELHISRNDVNKRNFVNYFMKFWAN